MGSHQWSRGGHKWAGVGEGEGEILVCTGTLGAWVGLGVVSCPGTEPETSLLVASPQSGVSRNEMHGVF